MGYGKLYTEVYGSHTEDEWQEMVRRCCWRCFYCGSPLSAWRDQKGRVFEIRARNADRPWESSGKVMAFALANRVSAEHILTKDHLVPLFHNTLRVEQIWNIRPACWRCNRMKGNKTAQEFLNERPGMILSWVNSLPVDDWRVAEWDSYHTNEEFDAAIERRLAQDSNTEGQASTGVFALASEFGVGSGVEAGITPGADVEIDPRLVPEGLEGGGVVVDSTSLPEVFSPSDIRNIVLLKKLREEREQVSWFWRNRA